MPEKDQEEFTADGWFKTGTSARSTSALRPHRRPQQDLIISGGYNVYPAEIEATSTRCRAWPKAALVGVPHRTSARSASLSSSPSPGRRSTPSSIVAGLKGRLANFKIPSAASSCPTARNTMGKVQKNLLREQHKALFS